MNWGLSEQQAALGAVVHGTVRPIALSESLFAEPLRPAVAALSGWRNRTGSWPKLADLAYLPEADCLRAVTPQVAQWAGGWFEEVLVRAALAQFALDVGEASEGSKAFWVDLPRKLDSALGAARAVQQSLSRDEEALKARQGTVAGGRLFVPYGIPDLESLDARKLGLVEGEVGAVVAATNVGKSFFLVHCGMQALRASLPVMHVSLEMSRSDTEQRYMSGMLSKTNAELAALADNTYLELLHSILPEASFLCMHYPMRSVGFPLVVSDFKRWLDSIGRQGLLIIDYPQLFRAQSDRRHEQLKELYEEIVGVAQSERCPVWAAHQSNRGGLDKETDVGLGNFSESYDATNPLHEVVALNQTPAEKINGRMRLTFAKRRNAATGSACVSYDWSRVLITEGA